LLERLGENNRMKKTTGKALLGVLFLLVTTGIMASPVMASTTYSIISWSSVSHPTTTGVYKGITSVDIDGDGLEEIIAGHALGIDSVIEIWSYDPESDSWILDQSIARPAGESYWHDPHWIEATDLDYDGDIDLVVPQRWYGTWVLWNEGNGVWSKSRIDTTYGWSAATGDIDKDGNMDIVLNTDWKGIKVYYGDGSRGFTLGPKPKATLSYQSGWSYLVDINGDGYLDICGYQGEWYPKTFFLRVYLYKGNKEWHPDSGPGETSYPKILYPGDINEDGRIDLVTTDLWGVGPQDIDVYYQTETGGWNMIPTINETEVLRRAWVADINRDNHLDIIALGGYHGATPGATGIYVYLGDGTGKFSTNVGIVNTNYYQHLTIGDFNGDSYPNICADGWGSPEHIRGLDVWFTVLPATINSYIQGLPAVEFTKPEEDVADIKDDFADKFADVEENINEEDYERAIQHLEEIIDFVDVQIKDPEKQGIIIRMIAALIAHLETL
jgi:hypothetical protein